MNNDIETECHIQTCHLPEPEPHRFAWLLRESMSALDVSLIDIAETFGVSQGAVKRWLSGASHPMPKMMRSVLYAMCHGGLFYERARGR